MGVVPFYYKKEYGGKTMKNKVVKQLLMVCMAMTLSVSMPMISLAAETKEEKNESEEGTDDVIEITKDKANTVFYKDDKLSVSYEKGEYTTGASDLVLTLDIENKYPNIVTLILKMLSWTIPQLHLNGILMIIKQVLNVVAVGILCWKKYNQ